MNLQPSDVKSTISHRQLRHSKTPPSFLGISVMSYSNSSPEAKLPLWQCPAVPQHSAAAQAHDWGPHPMWVLKQDIFLSPQLSSPIGKEWWGVTLAHAVRYLLPSTLMKGSSSSGCAGPCEEVQGVAVTVIQPPLCYGPHGLWTMSCPHNSLLLGWALRWKRGDGGSQFHPPGPITRCMSHHLNTHLTLKALTPTGLGCPNAIQRPGECTTWMLVPQHRDANCPVCSVTEDPGAFYNTLLCTACFRLPFRLWIRLGFGIFPFFGLLFGILFCLRFSSRGMRHFAPLAVCTWLWPTK